MRRRSRWHLDDGQATVEFALILPLFVLLIVAILDVTVIVRDQLLVDVLARDAARRASTMATIDDISDVVRDTVESAGRSDATWSVDVDDDTIRVQVELRPRSSLLLSSVRWLGGQQHVVGTATFATEYEVVDQ